MTALPANLSLSSIADGADIISADHRNNYSAIQAGYNALNNLLAGGTSGQFLVSGGPTAVTWTTKDTLYRKTTEKDVVSSTAETDLLNGEITIAAGVMTTAGVIHAHLQGDYLDNAAGNTVTLRMKLGGTTWFTGTATAATSSSRRSWSLDLWIANLGATNLQDAHGTFALSSPNLGALISESGGRGSFAATKGALTVDTTTAQALQVTCQNSVNSASASMRLESAIIRAIP